MPNPPPIERPYRLIPPPLPDSKAHSPTVHAPKAPSTEASPPETPPVFPVGNHQEDLESRSERQLKQFSGFLFSLIAHLAVLIVLALILIPRPAAEPLTLSIATAQDNSPWASMQDLSDITPVEISEPEQLDTQDSAPTESPLLDDSVDLVELDTSVVPGSTQATSDASAGTTPDSVEPKQANKSIKFFGAEAYGNSFVFVLDVSASMAARNGERLQRATRELIGSINQLNDQQNFSVILYSNHALPMFVNNNEAVMRQATPTNKQTAINWLRYQVRPNGGTMPAGALQIAGNLNPDAVFFLSDGEFLYRHQSPLNSPLNSFFQNFGQARQAMQPVANMVLDPETVLSEYAPKIVVHTIAFESRASGPLMEMIAKQKKGQYRFVPAP